MPRTIAVLTVGRSDFGRIRPVLKALDASPGIRSRLLAGGNHGDARFGETIREIADSGFEWVDGLGVAPQDDSAGAVGRAIAEGTRLLAGEFERDRPDLLVVLGDRYEMLAGANAALGFNLPVAHIHGGAVTEGAIDELVRHALTKMSHLHLVSCEPYAERLRQMGEEDWRVHVTGAPGLDGIRDLAEVNRAALMDDLGLDPTRPAVLVCFHPVTLNPERSGEQASALLAALDRRDEQLVLTYPNADPGSSAIIEGFERFAAARPGRVRLLKNAGVGRFAALMSASAAMVGNSSAAVVEAPAFELPAVDIGDRQQGKLKAANVIAAGHGADEIAAALARALDPAFRAGLAGLVNPHGDGKAGPRIAEILETVAVDEELLRKRFVDQ